jgi:putative cardiolipin synthase
MEGMRIRLLALVLLICPVGARATTYPWVQVGAEDLRLTSDSRVEASVRLEMIRQARHTIDVISYDQRADTSVALPLLKELRAAADRRVKVRFVAAWFPQYATDIHQVAPRYLTDPPAREPVEYVIFGGPELQPYGWNLSDGLHEKLVVIDGKWAIMTGRGHAEEYLDWIDTAFFLKGPLVDQARTAFEALWKVVRAEREPFQPRRTWFSWGRDRVPEFTPNPAKVALTPAGRAERDGLVAWLAQPAEFPAGRACPDGVRGRLLHHDFLGQMRRHTWRPASYSYEERIGILRDPVVEALTARLPSAREARLNMLTPMLHPSVRRALTELAGRGRLVELFTNGKEAYGAVMPLALPWTAGLPDLDEVIAGGVRAFGFAKAELEPWVYLHRKVAIIDDAVIFGSHNFNFASTVANDEMSVEIESPALAARLRELHDRAIRTNGWPLDGAAIRAERRRTGITRFLARPFLGFF